MTNNSTFSILEGVFGQGNVLEEWDVAKESQDALQRSLQYCPRIDFAIKPLNIDENFQENRLRIRKTCHRFGRFINDMKEEGLSNWDFRLNRNPRCFLAIEYENRTTTKHRLGSLINACAIGMIGIVVAVNDRTFRSYERIIEYLRFLYAVGKLRIIPNNFIVLKRNVFEGLLRSYQV